MFRTNDGNVSGLHLAIFRRNSEFRLSNSGLASAGRAPARPGLICLLLALLSLIFSLGASTPAVADRFTVGPGSTCPTKTVTSGGITVKCDDLKNAYYDAGYVAQGSLCPESFSLQVSAIQLPCTPNSPGGCGVSSTQGKFRTLLVALVYPVPLRWAVFQRALL